MKKAHNSAQNDMILLFHVPKNTAHPLQEITTAIAAAGPWQTGDESHSITPMKVYKGDEVAFEHHSKELKTAYIIVDKTAPAPNPS